jgi:hypothetical protein
VSSLAADRLTADARNVLEELSGASERRMIIPMMTTGRLQQRYDHRLRDLVGLELPILALIPGLGNVARRPASDLR